MQTGYRPLLSTCLDGENFFSEDQVWACQSFGGVKKKKKSWHNVLITLYWLVASRVRGLLETKDKFAIQYQQDMLYSSLYAQKLQGIYI